MEPSAFPSPRETVDGGETGDARLSGIMVVSSTVSNILIEAESTEGSSAHQIDSDR